MRPCQGLAGLIDFRLAGRLSALMRRGKVTGERGETVLLPGTAKLSLERVAIVGAGSRESFDDETTVALIARMLDVSEGLGVQSCVVELPGRADELLPPERAADILLASAGRAREDDVWTLVEGASARDRITQHMIEARRRVRRAF